jgi:RHH-type proline utilization regulon transcriptional repressor/proline dehydrogenase/delta 1-pyrroline-5-carboxylate dehydrogenase
VQRFERDQVAAEAVALVEKWLTEAKKVGSRSAAEKRLARILKDPKGLNWTLSFVDRVIRPSDKTVAAAELYNLSTDLPKSLSSLDRLTIRVGGLFAKPFSFIVIPIAKARLRQLVGHLIADARSRKLKRHIARSKSKGISLNLNLLGEAVLGEREANYRFDETFNLLKRKDVDYVSIKLSAVASQLSMWGFDQTVERLIEKLTPLYTFAAQSPTPKFINLDMEEYRDLGLTMLVFKRLLSKPELHNLEAGIVLQAYLPDSYAALKELTEFAQLRTSNGGAGIKVRIVKGANLAMELVDANWHGWQLATYSTKAESDANYKRLIDYALHTDRISALRIGVAGHNLFDLAFAHELSMSRGIHSRVEFEMLQGMAQHLSTQVMESVGSLLLYTPVVRPTEFQVAVAYLTRRLEENGSPDNFMSGVFDIDSDRNVFDRERLRFETSLRIMAQLDQNSNRKQDRLADISSIQEISFENVADTDPALPNNREWVRQAIAGAQAIAGKLKTHESYIAEANIDAYAIEELVANSRAAASSWANDRALRKQLLLQAGVELANRRGTLLQLMMAEAGKTVGEADAELSEAIDFANFYAHSIEEITRTEELDAVVFEPHKLVVVTPPWNFPVAIAAGGVLAALAAGSAVIIKPAPQVANCVLAMVDALWRAGIPKDVLQIAFVPDNQLGLQLVGHSDVDAVILTGSFETAQLFKTYRPKMQLSAETSGKNAIVITPNADLDIAAADLAKSAFGHAGQKCSAASLGILVGSVYKNKQFLAQLVDAVESMKVGYGFQADASVGPLIEEPSERLLKALTTLEPGETWLLEPKQLDDSGRLWRPGIKYGVKPGSFFHTTECFGPVLGLIKANNLSDALAIQNSTDYGLTAGIHSLNAFEIKSWTDQIDAGNLYVNRGITGAIVERQPFGGFKRSSVGFGLKAGGRNYILQFGKFRDSAEKFAGLNQYQISGVSKEIAKYVHEVELLLENNRAHLWLEMAAASDQYWSRELFNADLNPGGLVYEANYHRYLTNGCVVRVSANASRAELCRAVLALLNVKHHAHRISIAPEFLKYQELSKEQLSVLAGGIRFDIEAELDIQVKAGTRLISLGTKEEHVRELEANPDLFVYSAPMTKSARVLLLNLYREQSISITQHRYGALQNEVVNIFGASRVKP